MISKINSLEDVAAYKKMTKDETINWIQLEVSLCNDNFDDKKLTETQIKKINEYLENEQAPALEDSTLKEYEKLANEGSDKFCYVAGRERLLRGENDKAADWFRRGSDKKISKCSFELAKMYEEGTIDGGINLEQAENYYRKASLEKHIEAKYRLYKLIKDTSPKEALDLLTYLVNRRNLTGECVYAYREYGRMLEDGRGVAVDKAKAAEYYRKGKDKFDYEAAFRYGLLCIEGVEGANAGEAFEIFNELDQHYHNMNKEKEAEAEYYLGVIYEKGIGVNKNEETARRYYHEAKIKGNKKAENAFKRFEAKTKIDTTEEEYAIEVREGTNLNSPQLLINNLNNLNKEVIGLREEVKSLKKDISENNEIVIAIGANLDKKLSEIRDYCKEHYYDTDEILRRIKNIDEKAEKALADYEKSGREEAEKLLQIEGESIFSKLDENIQHAIISSLALRKCKTFNRERFDFIDCRSIISSLATAFEGIVTEKITKPICEYYEKNGFDISKILGKKPTYYSLGNAEFLLTNGCYPKNKYDKIIVDHRNKALEGCFTCEDYKKLNEENKPKVQWIDYFNTDKVCTHFVYKYREDKEYKSSTFGILHLRRNDTQHWDLEKPITEEDMEQYCLAFFGDGNSQKISGGVNILFYVLKRIEEDSKKLAEEALKQPIAKDKIICKQDNNDNNNIGIFIDEAINDVCEQDTVDIYAATDRIKKAWDKSGLATSYNGRAEESAKKLLQVEGIGENAFVWLNKDLQETIILANALYLYSVEHNNFIDCRAIVIPLAAAFEKIVIKKIIDPIYKYCKKYNRSIKGMAKKEEDLYTLECASRLLTRGISPENKYSDYDKRNEIFGAVFTNEEFRRLGREDKPKEKWAEYFYTDKKCEKLISEYQDDDEYKSTAFGILYDGKNMVQNLKNTITEDFMENYRCAFFGNGDSQKVSGGVNILHHTLETIKKNSSKIARNVRRKGSNSTNKLTGNIGTNKKQ